MVKLVKGSGIKLCVILIRADSPFPPVEHLFLSFCAIVISLHRTKRSGLWPTEKIWKNFKTCRSETENQTPKERERPTLETEMNIFCQSLWHMAYGYMDWAMRLQCGPWSHASHTLNVFHLILWSSQVVICIWFTHHILTFSSLPTTTKINNKKSLPP